MNGLNTLKAFQEILKKAQQEKAKSIFLFEGMPVFIKGDGIGRLNESVMEREDIEGFLTSTMTEWQRKRFEEEKEIDYGFEFDSLRFRVSGFLRRGLLGCVIRPIPERIPSLEELLLPPILKEFARKRQGLFLVTGPTGSGKSTTLASMIDLINEERPCHIVTIEDPIEFIFKPKKAIISQREVGKDTRSFSEALKRVLREDPDVILVGEIRDRESMKVTLELSETGHLVFSTLHTKDAIQTINRILDFFPSEEKNTIAVQLSQNLIGICSQRLLPKVQDSGFVCACEILRVTGAVKNLIREGKIHQIFTIMASSKKEGMITMDGAILELVNKGLVSLPEAISQTGEDKIFIEKAHEVTERRREIGIKKGLIRLERDVILYEVDSSDLNFLDTSGILYDTPSGLLFKEISPPSQNHYIIDYSILNGKRDSFSLNSFFSMEYRIKEVKRRKEEYLFQLILFLSASGQVEIPRPYFPLRLDTDWHAITIPIPGFLKGKQVRYLGLLFDRDIKEIFFRKINFF